MNDFLNGWLMNYVSKLGGGGSLKNLTSTNDDITHLKHSDKRGGGAGKNPNVERGRGGGKKILGR